MYDCLLNDSCFRKALTYRFSSADVDKILASKEKFSAHPHNYAMTKARLQKEREQHLGNVSKNIISLRSSIEH